MDRPGALRRNGHGKVHRDAAVAALAGRQHGVVEREQLRSLGISDDVIDWWLATGRLHPIYRGVYAVGHRAITITGRWMAAVLAAPEGAVLSHRAAAGLWQIRDSQAVEVTVGRTRSCRAEFLVHRLPLAPDEVDERAGIPVTGLARTQFDLAAVLPR